MVIGADIGGSHITVATVNIKEKCLVGNTVRKTVDSKGSKPAILNSWKSAIQEAISLSEKEIDKLAFAMPGPFDYANGISYIKDLNKYDALYGLDIRAYFADELHIAKENILFRNDAEAFLHGEMFCGAGKSSTNAIGLTLGTGFGSAISDRGLTTDLNLGSEPFKDSIADDYFSTRWFVNRYKAVSGFTALNVKELLAIADKSVQSVIFEEFAINLSVFLMPVLKRTGVQTLILGGNIAKAGSLFLPHLSRCLSEQNLNVTFKFAELNEQAALIGAAASFEPITVM